MNDYLKIVYDEKGNRVFINNVQHFTNISPEVWGFKIGPNQVLEKWLKLISLKQM